MDCEQETFLDSVYLTTKRHSYRVWTSFGITKQMIPFLDTLEQIHLQTVNMFWYKIAVSRVQSVIPVHMLYFAWSESAMFRRTIFQINAATMQPFRFED